MLCECGIERFRKRVLLGWKKINWFAEEEMHRVRKRCLMAFQLEKTEIG